MCGSTVDIQSQNAEIRRGIKKKRERRRKKPQDENIMSASATQGGYYKAFLTFAKHYLWSPYVIGQTIIFSCCGLFFFLSSFFMVALCNRETIYIYGRPM